MAVPEFERANAKTQPNNIRASADRSSSGSLDGFHSALWGRQELPRVLCGSAALTIEGRGKKRIDRLEAPLIAVVAQTPSKSGFSELVVQ